MSDTSNADGGNANDDQSNSDEVTQDQDQSNDTGRAGSDDALKVDLANERKARQAAQKAQKTLEKRLEALETATKSESERAIDQARKEGATEAVKSANLKLAKMAIRVAAADKLADPSDADIIDASQFEVDDDGNVDTKAVNAEIDRLLKDKPHWAKQDKKSNGSADQGARGRGAKATDMNSLIRQMAGQ